MTHGSLRDQFENVGATSAFSQSKLEIRYSSSSLETFLIKLAIGEFFLVCVTAYASSAVYYCTVLLQWPDLEQHLAGALWLGITVCGVTVGFRGYSAIETGRHEFMRTGVSAIMIAFALFALAMFLLKIEDAYSRGGFIFQLACILAAVLTLRGVSYSRLQAAVVCGRIATRRVILIGSPEHCSHFSRRLSLTGIRTVRTFGFLAENGTEIDPALQSSTEAAYARDLIKQCRSAGADNILVLASEKHLSRTKALALALSELPINLHVFLVDVDRFIDAGRIVLFGNLATIQVARRPLSMTGRFFKRSFDLLLAAVGLVLLAPLLLFVAAIIKLDSPGPVLFRQTRHGFNNKPIRVLKFRSMFVMEDGATFKQVIKGDERVTRFGKILRRTNIDELPQLLNVLFGDMSIVGPRPHAMAHNEMFEHLIWPFYRRHNVKPGITGWAQVNGFRGETDTLEKMQRRIECDLYYIDNWSLLLDIRIVLMTLFSAAAYSNAY